MTTTAELIPTAALAPASVLVRTHDGDRTQVTAHHVDGDWAIVEHFVDGTHLVVDVVHTTAGAVQAVMDLAGWPVG